MPEPENMVLHLLQELRGEIRKLDSKVDGIGVDLRSEMKSLRADVASDLMTLEQRMSGQILTLEKHMSEQIVGLRREVVEYHSSVVGHGLLIGDLDERVRRLETASSGSH